MCVRARARACVRVCVCVCVCVRQKGPENTSIPCFKLFFPLYVHQNTDRSNQELLFLGRTVQLSTPSWQRRGEKESTFSHADQEKMDMRIRAGKRGWGRGGGRGRGVLCPKGLSFPFSGTRRRCTLKRKHFAEKETVCVCVCVFGILACCWW